MYWYYEDVCADLWVPDFGNIRWRRQLGLAIGVYQYQRTDTSTNAVSAWGPVAALGHPAAPPQILAANAPTRLLVDDSDQALAAYQWLQTLTGALGGRLLQVRNTIATLALQQAAGSHYDTVNDLATDDAQAYQRAQNAITDADRTRLIRLGVRFHLDAHHSVLIWVQQQGMALGVHQQPLLVIAGRGNDLGGKLLNLLH